MKCKIKALDNGETAMRYDAMHSLAVCDPLNAEKRMYEPSTKELAYLRAMIQLLGTRTDRYITEKIRAAAQRAADAV